MTPKMRRRLAGLALLAPLWLWTPGAAAQPAGSGGVPYHAADASAPPVTEANLLTAERFWPYQVELVRAWEPGGPVAAGTRGVLVRVQEDGTARIDFGRDGVHAVPLGRTDVVERANAIREGRAGKLGPNLAHVLGPRLVDARHATIGPVSFQDTFGVPGYLSVHAAPEHFAEIASTLAPLQGRHGVWTVVFPHTREKELAIYRQLRALEWPVVFVPSFLAEGYTESRLAAPVRPPAVQLETREGRLLFQAAWNDDTAAAVAAVLDAHFTDGSQRDVASAGAE